MATTPPSAKPLVPEVVTSWLVEFDPRSAGLEVRDDLESESSFTSTEACSVFFAGVLFNRPEIERDLGVGSATMSEAELIAQLYLKRGDRIAEGLNGTFALLIRDAAHDTLLCVRDRMGVHPLFYAEAGDSLVFSDSIETLVRAPGVSSVLNRRLLALHVWPAWWIEDKDETYLEAVKRVVAGHVLRFRVGGRDSWRYWNPAPPGEEVDWVVEDEATERFEAALSKAVERSLSRGPAAICLSGGLDSISIASFAVELAARDGWPTPQALSVEFPDPDNLGEAGVQRQVAAHLGMPQIMRPLEDALGGNGLLPTSLELSGTWPVPLLGIFSPAYFPLIEEAKANGCRVVMTGAGGDNWLAVTLDYAADRIARFDLLALVRLWYMMQRSYRAPAWLLARSIFWKYGLRNVLVSLEQHGLRRVAPGLLQRQTTIHATRSIPEWLAPDRALRTEILELAVTRKLDLKPKPGDFYNSEIRRGLDHPILAVDLEESFEKGRRLGVEIRQPYFDADLVDLLCRTHPRVLARGGRSKSLVRESMASRVAGLGIERQKKITTGNFWPKKLEEATVCWEKFGGVRALGELGVVDAKALSDEVTQMLAEKCKAAVPFVWEILDHEAWVRARL